MCCQSTHALLRETQSDCCWLCTDSAFIHWLEMSAVHCVLASLSLKYRLWAEQPKPRILVNSLVWAAGRKTLLVYGGSWAEVQPTVHARLRSFRREERKHPKAPSGRRQWRALLNVCKFSCTVRAVPITTSWCHFKVNKQGEKQHFQ
jgi:hypothetical protein